MYDAGDHQQLYNDKIALKLLRLTSTSRDGFILSDFPSSQAEAEVLEEFRGGMNSFVHISVPDNVAASVESAKLACQDCGREYHPVEIRDQEQGIWFDSYLPEDGHCHDCGSTNITAAGSADKFQ